jgi:hypothetical protein
MSGLDQQSEHLIKGGDIMDKMGEIAVFIRNEDGAIDPLDGTIIKACCTGDDNREN